MGLKFFGNISKTKRMGAKTVLWCFKIVGGVEKKVWVEM